jgi:hypothetical protein
LPLDQPIFGGDRNGPTTAVNVGDALDGTAGGDALFHSTAPARHAPTGTGRGSPPRPASPPQTGPPRSWDRLAPEVPDARHNLHGAFHLLHGKDAAAFEALRAGLRGRLAPLGEAEAHWRDEPARAYWRQRRLFALEDAALTAPLAEAVAGTDRLPSLATLARYRARVERDARLAREQLAALRAADPRPLNRHKRRLLKALRRYGAAAR